MRKLTIFSLSVFILLGIYSKTTFSQIDNNVGIGTLTPDQTAILHLESNRQGFLPPCLTTFERDAITNPHIGLMIFNKTDSTMQYYTGNCWLHVFQENCDDCIFDMFLSDTAGVINRTTIDSVLVTITVQQTSGTPQSIGLFLVSNLPTGVTTYLTNPVINYSGSSDLIIHANIFANPGVYPIAIQGICGSIVKYKIYQLTIDSCYAVSITASQNNYNIQSANSLPGPGTPICVVATVFPGVILQSASSTQPVLTLGNLDTQSHVGIVNHGALLGRGGDGATGGTFSTFGNPGVPGGNAINMTTRMSILTTTFGNHFAGGGGGGSVGLGYSVNIPIIGALNLAVGAGGGGGAADGLGGTSSLGGIQINVFEPGDDATGGVMGQGGAGGNLNYQLNIPLGPASATITPGGQGGDGGGYGQPGTSGNVYVHILIQVTLPWPIGTITVVNYTYTPNITFPPGGQPGYVIKRNNFPLIGVPNMMPDAYYQSGYFKGFIGN